MIIFRLKPKKDLKQGIIDILNHEQIKSGIIICIVGSLCSATLRMANGTIKTFEGPFEIVSSQGTVSENGIHIHIAVSDTKGHVIGGHLREGCIINTTAEICILKSYSSLKRVLDLDTGYKELLVED